MLLGFDAVALNLPPAGGLLHPDPGVEPLRRKWGLKVGIRWYKVSFEIWKVCSISLKQECAKINGHIEFG